MADTATSPEKLAEIKADEAPQEVAAPEPATESAEVSTSADAPEDAPMLDESGEDQTLKAVRQSKLKIDILLLPMPLTLSGPTVEFYFADANLPYDKYGRFIPPFVPETHRAGQIHVDTAYCQPGALGAYLDGRFLQAHARVQLARRGGARGGVEVECRARG